MTTAFSDETLREASEWYARLLGGDATAQDHLRLGDWLAARPENRLAYTFVTETGRLAAHIHPASNGRRKPAPARRSSLRGVQAAGAPAARRRWARAAGVAAAAAIVAGIGVAIVMRPDEQNFATAVGEIRNVTLSDGSTLALNGATKLTVRFTGDARELDIETGEFFVAVGKDPARPFRVHAKGRVIEDIGTAFDVDTNGSQVDVTVGQGTVMISNPLGDGSTAVGEIRNVTLSDGSTLALNGATKLTVRFTGDARELDIETGEFFITVGKDPSRPFRVHAKGRVIEDIGTAFDVDTNGSQVDVAVGQGTVMISNPLDGESTAARAIVLNAGEALSYSADQSIGTPRPLAASDVASWRAGVLSYDRSRLEWLVADLNHRFDHAITIPDATLAALPITLTLKLHDRETTIGTLEKLLPVRAVAQPDGSTELVSLNP